MSWTATLVLGFLVIALVGILAAIFLGYLASPVFIITSVTTLALTILFLGLYILIRYFNKSFRNMRKKPRHKKIYVNNSFRSRMRPPNPIDQKSQETLMKSIKGIPFLIQAIQYSMETTLMASHVSEMGRTSVIHTAPVCRHNGCDSDEEREETLRRLSPMETGPEQKWLPEDPRKWTNQQLRLSMNRASQALLVFPYSENSSRPGSFDRESTVDVESIVTPSRGSFETADLTPSTKIRSSNELSPRPSEIRCIGMSTAIVNKFNSSFKQREKL